MYKNELVEDFITIVLITVPIIIVTIKRKTFKEFSYKKFVIALDYTLIGVIIIGTLLFPSVMIIDNNIDKIGLQNQVVNIIMDEATLYFVFGICLYPMLVIIFNIPLLIWWIKNKII